MKRFSHIFVVLVHAAFLLSSTTDAFQNARVLQGPQLAGPPSDFVGRTSMAPQSRSQLSMAADPGTKKETFIDRLTGPKLFKTVTNWNGIHSVPLVPLRILTGLLMIHHGSEGA